MILLPEDRCIKTESKRLPIFGAVFTGLTIFLIIYWLLDIPAGIAVAIFAYWSTSDCRGNRFFEPLEKGFEGIVDRLRDMLISLSLL